MRPNKTHHIKKILTLTLIISMLLSGTTLGSTSSIHDDDTPEIFIDEIISPPLYGRTGNYDVTVKFSAIDITINGIKDYNEPWVEHCESPDNDLRPNINFYTTCDEENMYITFENTARTISRAEIFIDKNMNNIWDPITDSLLVINITAPKPSKVKDGDYSIPTSDIGWGDRSFIEVKIPKANWSSHQNWAYIVYSSTEYQCVPILKNPSWDDDTLPTPPDNEFLNFPYDCESNCPCGVAFKALTDIFKINSGECSTIYKTDFENLSNVTRDWQTKSLDTNPDTWNISKNRTKSPIHSFHCTNNENYYGNALDILEMKNSLDLSNVINVSFSFWHHCTGDTYTSNDHTKIADYGDIEIYTNVHDEWVWVSLSDLGVSNLYYDNDWTQTTIKIEKSKLYPSDGENVSGYQLLTDETKFRFVWKSSPQFQYEGWYIDDVQINVCQDEHYDPLQPIWQGWEVICLPFGSTQTYTFPLQWNASEEGKYLVRVCFQEERPWHSPIDVVYVEKVVTIGDIHDIAVTSLRAPSNIDKDKDLNIKATVKNIGTYNENNIQVKATIKKEGETIWQETVIIPTLNISDEVLLNFTWEDTTYCDHILEVRAILPDDEIPLNNSMSKPVVVATTIFTDSMNDECKWTHSDLTGGAGHWNICTSGDDKYLWCGTPETTQYSNNWNDVATINHSLALPSNTILTFDSYYRTNQSDYCYVEISPDGGRHWQTIDTFTAYSDWQHYTYDISPHSTSNTKIRFRFFSNQSITDRGWILDNITVSNETTTFFNDNFEQGNTNKWIIERQRAGDWWQLVKKQSPTNSNNMAWWCGDETTNTYPSNLNNALTLDGACSDTIDLSKAFDASIIFSTWHNLSSGDSGILEITNNAGSTWSTLATITGNSPGKTPQWTNKTHNIKTYIGGEISIRFRFISDNTNESEGWYIDNVKIVAKLDLDPPVTTHTLTGTMGNNNWYTTSVQATLTASDDYSGVKNTYYKLNTGTQTTYTSPITLSDGTHTIEYWSDDNIGNTESSHTTSFKIDSTPPTVNITRPDAGVYWRDHKIWPLIRLSLFKWATPFIINDITIIAEANDDTSSIAYLEFYIDDDTTPISTDNNAPFEYNCDETLFFKHTITIKAHDNAGNTATTSKDVRIFNIRSLFPRSLL